MEYPLYLVDSLLLLVYFIFLRLSFRINPATAVFIHLSAVTRHS